MKISQIIANMHAEMDGASAYLGETGVATRLQLASGTVTGFATKVGVLDSSFTIYASPRTQTPESIIAVNTDFDKAIIAYRSIQRTLKNNGDITLLPADIAALHIHQDAARRHDVPAKDFSPNNQVTLQTHCVTKVFVNNPTPGQEDKKHKPDDVKAVGWALCYVANGSAAPVRKDYNTMADIGAVIFNIISDADEVNMDGYLITWYVSPTGERSPESRPLKFTVI